MSKTDYDKALEWLQDKMEGGRYDGAKLLIESEAAGIKRSDIMKATGQDEREILGGTREKQVFCL